MGSEDLDVRWVMTQNLTKRRACWPAPTGSLDGGVDDRA